jgi:hypothetical protein
MHETWRAGPVELRASITHLFHAAASTSSIFMAGLALVVSGCSSSSSHPAFGSGPPIPSADVGTACAGFGTSDGALATFSDTMDCAGGICLVDLRGNSLLSYCSADCTAKSCPSGTTCEAVTLGVVPYVCVLNPGAASQDAGSTRPASDAASDSGTHEGGTGKEGGAAGSAGSACTSNSQCQSDLCNSATYCCANNQADNGSSCAVPTDCCNNGCSGGVCCSPVAAPCFGDSDCCSGVMGACQNVGANGLGTCAATPGASCTQNSNCTPFVCGTTCQPSSGGGCVETPNTCCQPGGDTCSQDSDCCEPSSGGTQCSGGTCCFSFGSSCQNDAQCCGVSCTNGTCGG